MFIFCFDVNDACFYVLLFATFQNNGRNEQAFGARIRIALDNVGAI